MSKFKTMFFLKSSRQNPFKAAISIYASGYDTTTWTYIQQAT